MSSDSGGVPGMGQGQEFGLCLAQVRFGIFFVVDLFVEGENVL